MILLLQNDSDSDDTDDDIWDAFLPEPAESTQTQGLAWEPFPPLVYDDPNMVIGLPKKDGDRQAIPHWQGHHTTDHRGTIKLVDGRA